MRQNRPIPFKISSLDSLGQGVSKLSERITFIPKTLPGEEGTAFIQAEKKGVTFAKMTSLSASSPDRIAPQCPHFDVCPSCHYLHTSYENELASKKENFLKLFRNLPLPEVKVVPAVRRTGYRNRVQLHYDTKIRKMGMLDPRTHEILNIPNCVIGVGEVQEAIRNLYLDEQWLKLAPKNSPRGHVEIYRKENSTEINWNSSYALGGFTQVFEEMNSILHEEIRNWFPVNKPAVLDLFAGNGNLTNKLPYSQRLCVDVYSEAKGSDFYSCSLYEPESLRKVSSILKKKNLNPSILILDPPRSGLLDLKEWLTELTPTKVAYVSCDPHTMVRDLQKITEYRPTGAVLLDFFPSTFHFESLIFLERN